MFLENSRDVLNLILAFAIVWLTVFLCWLLYYLVMTARSVRKTIEEIRGRFRAIEDGVKAIRERFEHASHSLTFISEGVIRLINYFIDRRREKAAEEPAEEQVEPKKKGK
jgi:hypothetical protein